MKKNYVSVNCNHDCEGNVTPSYLLWEDGRKFEIDRVLEVRKAASPRTGGSGTRYTCRIKGRPIYLYCEDGQGKWFVESK